MGSMKAQALEELKSRLRQKFGDGAEITATLDREVSTFFGPRATISVEDLDAFDNRLTTVLGFPARRRSQWAKLSKASVSSSQRYANVSQDKETPSEPPFIKSRLATRSLDLKEKFPAIDDIVPVTRHWKPVKTVRDSPIFPRFENRETYTPSPNRVNVNDTMRTTFNWKYGDTVERLNKSQAPDEWGDILKWDTTKFLWEKDDQRRAMRMQQQEYSEFLKKQVEQRAQKLEELKAEQSKDKQDALEQVEKDRALDSQQARTLRQQRQQHRHALQQLIDEKERQRLAALEQKWEEGRRIQQKHDAELSEELERLHGRRKHNMSLTVHNLKSKEEQLAEKRARKLESRIEGLKRAEAAEMRTEAIERQRRQLSLNMARTTQEENQLLALQRVPATPESVNTAHGELFRKHETRVKQAKLHLLQNVSVLAQQMQEKTMKDEEWRHLSEEQAALWRKEIERQAQEDAEAARKLKQNKAAVKHGLLKQMDEKQQRNFHERRLSPAEAKFNRHLFKAACGSDAI